MIGNMPPIKHKLTWQKRRREIINLFTKVKQTLWSFSLESHSSISARACSNSTRRCSNLRRSRPVRLH